jgi:hypothetical protein
MDHIRKIPDSKVNYLQSVGKLYDDGLLTYANPKGTGSTALVSDFKGDAKQAARLIYLKYDEHVAKKAL